MFEKNIFIRKSDGAENKLTEAFIQLLACLETPLLNNILKHLGIKDIGKNIIFNLQPKGEKSTPDAVISSDRFAIFVEVKRTSPLEVGQLRRHAKFLLRNHSRFKLLLIISPDYYEIEKIKRQWLNYTESHNVMSRFFSWTEISHILQKLKKQSKSKDKFLLGQFVKYLKEEKVVIMTKGFQKKDCAMWTNFMKLSVSLNDILFNVIKGYIKSLRPKWVYKSPFHRADEIKLHFNTTKSSKYLKFYSGFFVGDKERNGWEEPCFYVGWVLRKRQLQRLENSHSQIFKNKENKLRKNRFISWEPSGDFYSILKIKDIAKKKTTEKQIQCIKKFIKGSIQKFNKIGLSNLI